ncbi:uncharacterized protein BCR38DRAFT_49748 [Pseudomassariella vexata]|uniref:Uncharacterized protein n=1 Tax=Pseudomassariella vexata TaxID=1141098 RepID=A0A1Y2DNV3_9PEZI|nr:uncharacterized protein BCR38DRAFT_49748 [Pseudomassariella vexata]ORY60958.1 hypothetical protein BCR38DRAFT_49748 [Pseudomassariella vexata]
MKLLESDISPKETNDDATFLTSRLSSCFFLGGVGGGWRVCEVRQCPSERSSAAIAIALSEWQVRGEDECIFYNCPPKRHLRRSVRLKSACSLIGQRGCSPMSMSQQYRLICQLKSLPSNCQKNYCDSFDGKAERPKLKARFGQIATSLLRWIGAWLQTTSRTPLISASTWPRSITITTIMKTNPTHDDFLSSSFSNKRNAELLTVPVVLYGKLHRDLVL